MNIDELKMELNRLSTMHTHETWIVDLGMDNVAKVFIRNGRWGVYLEYTGPLPTDLLNKGMGDSILGIYIFTGGLNVTPVERILNLRQEESEPARLARYIVESALGQDIMDEVYPGMPDSELMQVFDNWYEVLTEDDIDDERIAINQTRIRDLSMEIMKVFRDEYTQS